MTLKRTNIEWLQLLKKAKSGHEVPAKARFTQTLRQNVLQDDVEKSKRLRCNRVCFARSFADLSRAKRLFYLSKFLSLPKKSG